MLLCKVYEHRGCANPTPAWPLNTTAEPCPVSQWSQWSPCDASCGSGQRTRVRLTLPPALQLSTLACSSLAPFIQMQACVSDTAAACSPADQCSYGAWTNWGPCSAACGGGVQLATRTVSSASCGPVLKTQLCNTQACV